VAAKTLARLSASWSGSTFRLYVATLVRIMSWRVALALALMLFRSATQGAQLLLLVPLMALVGLEVQGGSVGWIADAVSSAFEALSVSPTLPAVLVAFVLFSGLLALITRWQTVSNFRLQQDFVHTLRRRLYRAVANSDWPTFSRSRPSDFTHALTNELNRVGGATEALLGLVTQVVLVSVYVLLALRLSPEMSVLVFVCGAGLLLALRGKTRAARWTGEEISLATNGLYAASIEHLGGMKTTKSYGDEERSADLFADLSGRVSRMHLGAIRNYAETSFWFQVGSVLILSFLLYVSFEILALQTAGMLLLLFLFTRIVPLFSGVQQSYQHFLNALPAFSRVAELQERCEAAAEPAAGRLEEVELEAGVRFEDVSFAYAAGASPAVSGLGLELRAGQTTAIVGPSGAGKSTVADLVMGLVLPSSGRITVGGRSLDAGRIRPWRSRIGYVAQDTFLFNDTIRANLLWACPGATEPEMEEALRASAAAELVASLPDGLETVLGDRGVRLSGGERQRLALARALLRKPELLILDEATSALDSESERRIQSAIEGLHGQMTILIITHRLSTIREADVIHVLEGGRLVESGGWEELSDREDGRFKALCRAQSLA